MRLTELRNQYHKNICQKLLRISAGKGGKADYPNNADGDSKISVDIAWVIVRQICVKPKYESISGQRAGTLFQQLTRNYLRESFGSLQHLRPGQWIYSINTAISEFDQYRDLAELAKIVKENPKLASTFGYDYIVKPDVIIGREPISDAGINKGRKFLEAKDPIAKLTPLRKANYKKPTPILHASISCKWTLRSDRAQNSRTEALNLIRNRKGTLPHIVVVTAEPTATRIASLALGAGDIDCVYHFALNELQFAIDEIGDESQADMLRILIDGRRLRDISDLPLDLAS